MKLILSKIRNEKTGSTVCFFDIISDGLLLCETIWNNQNVAREGEIGSIRSTELHMQ